ncbi:hypothetical protein Tco_0957242 [Tanacetum coccineum]
MLLQHYKLNANSELKCVKCNGCMLSDNHDMCVLDYINNVNARAKSKSSKKQTKRKVWKPTGKMFTTIGYIWRTIGQTFAIVGNACLLTRITTTTEAPLRKPVVLDNEMSKPAVLQYVSANKKEPSKSWGSIISDVPSSSLNECRSSKLSSGIWTSAAPSIGSEIALSSPISSTNSWVQLNSEMIMWQRFWDMVNIRLGMLRYEGFTMWKDLDTTYSSLGSFLI